MFSSLLQTTFYRWIIPAVVCQTLGNFCLAQQDPPVFVIPEAAERYAAFGLQGEYRSTDLGVQVVARGSDDFLIVQFAGGLPGEGANMTQRSETRGTASEVRQVTQGMERVDRESPTLGASPPDGAIVLFDGLESSLRKHWSKNAEMTPDGLLKSGCTSRETFRDFTAHVEFRTPFMPEALGQKRGNSGVYWQGRYETQILDSFGLAGESNECGGIYRVAKPKLNMCLPPLTWQAYDVDFRAARFDEQNNKLQDAKLTVRLNGVLVHESVSVPKHTTAAPVKEGPEPGPIYLQDHGNPVRYRNIWVLPR